VSENRSFISWSFYIVLAFFLIIFSVYIYRSYKVSEKEVLFFHRIEQCITPSSFDLSLLSSYSKEISRVEYSNILNAIPELKQKNGIYYIYVFEVDSAILAMVIRRNTDIDSITYWGLKKNPFTGNWFIYVIGGKGLNTEYVDYMQETDVNRHLD